MSPALTAISLLTALVLPSPGVAPELSTFSTQGATIRLIAQAPDAAGLVRGAVLFELDTGWKTYWQEPGEAGLAPVFQFAADGVVLDPALFFPAPIHLEEGGTPFNGYDGPVAIAFEASVGDAAILELDLLAGICRDLCVPVSAHLSRQLGEPLGFAEITAVERAFLSRPADHGETTGATLVPDILHVTAPTNVHPTDGLFVSGRAGWRFGVARNESGGWRVPILDRPKGPGDTAASFEAVIGGDGVGRRVLIVVDEDEGPSDGLPGAENNDP